MNLQTMKVSMPSYMAEEFEQMGKNNRTKNEENAEIFAPIFIYAADGCFQYCQSCLFFRNDARGTRPFV